MASLVSLRLARLPLSRRLISTTAPSLSNQNLKKHEPGFHAQSSTTILPNQPVTTLFPHGADASKPDPSTIADAPLTTSATILQAVGEAAEDHRLPDLRDFESRGRPAPQNSGINTPADQEDQFSIGPGDDILVKDGVTYRVYDPLEARRHTRRISAIPPWVRGFKQDERARSEDIEVRVVDSDADYHVNRVDIQSMMRFLPENAGTRLGAAVALKKVQNELGRDITKHKLYDPEFEMGRVRWNEARSKLAEQAVRGEYKGAAKQVGMLGSLERTLAANRTVSAPAKARMVAKVNVVASKLGVSAVPQLQAPKKGKRKAARLGKGTVRKAKALAKKAVDKKKAEGEKKKSVLVVKAQSLTQRKK